MSVDLNELSDRVSYDAPFFLKFYLMVNTKTRKQKNRHQYDAGKRCDEFLSHVKKVLSKC